jgi:hypothetical protein
VGASRTPIARMSITLERIATIVAQGTAKQPKRYAAETFVKGAFMTNTENEVIVARSSGLPRQQWAYTRSTVKR